MSNKTLPLELREKVAVKQELIPEILPNLVKACAITEALLMSTCNRTEIHAAAPSADSAPLLQRTLCNILHLSHEEMRGSWYTHTNGEAMRHLFRVAAGLDSMVVGESQVFGQLKEAYQVAFTAGTTGHLINQIVHRSLFVAKRVRTETGIGLGATSISSVAVDLIESSLCQRYTPTIMIIGTGEVGKAAAKSIRDRGLGNLILLNRTEEKAKDLAEMLGAETAPWETMEELLFKADAVITSCGSDLPILTQATLQDAMHKAARTQMLIIDLGVPRDVEPQGHRIPGLFLHNIDDLQSIADRNKEQRSQQIDHAETIIATEANEATKTILESECEPLIASLMQKCEDIRKREIERALSKLAVLNDEQKKVLEVCTTSLMNKILHDPIAALKKNAAPEREKRNSELLSLFKNIFRLE